MSFRWGKRRPRPRYSSLLSEDAAPTQVIARPPWVPPPPYWPAWAIEDTQPNHVISPPPAAIIPPRIHAAVLYLTAEVHDLEAAGEAYLIDMGARARRQGWAIPDRSLFASIGRKAAALLRRRHPAALPPPPIRPALPAPPQPQPGWDPRMTSWPA